MIDETILAKYDMTIGIECHVQLATKTKLFSGADNDARSAEANTVVSPIDFGLPGMLPVLNREAVNLAIKAGKALNADIARVSRFDRKHYFYPDLPKGYQTTQMYNPIILEGHVDAPLEDGSTIRVRVHHAHMEEDAGKLTHFGDYSLVDLNRAGTPLIEIVSEPDIHSPAGAKAYAIELYRLMTYAGVTRGDLYHGNMRFDVNLSIAPKGATELGTRAEVKNLNSFKSVERAAEYEFRRQVERVEKGERIVQETRGWDDAKQKTNSQRSKEDAQDYRYMPDADIPPIVLTEEEIAEIQATVPRLPSYYREAWRKAGFNEDIIYSLINTKTSAESLERIRNSSSDIIAKRIGFWFLKATDARLDENTDVQSNSDSIPDDYFITLSQMVEDGKLNSNAGDLIFIEMMQTSMDPVEIAKERNLLQENDEGAIAAIVEEILADPSNAQSLADLRNGKDKAIGFLVGQVMKKSAGKANPALAQRLIRERL